MGTRFDHVSVEKRTNVYLDGKCISFTFTFYDHSRKTVGVTLPSCIAFTANAAKPMKIVGGACRVSEGAW